MRQERGREDQMLNYQEHYDCGQSELDFSGKHEEQVFRTDRAPAD